MHAPSMAKKSKLCTEIICLSDDDDEGEENRTHKVQSNPIKPTVTPAKPKECPPVVKQDQPTTSERANWTVYEKDIIHVAPLPSQYTGIYKEPFEVRCSTIYFGLVEFSVNPDVLLMNESEFEMKLIGSFMDTLNIKLLYTDIIKFYFSYESRPPVALMQVRNEFGLLFDRYIRTSTENGRGFNPHSKDERRRHVIFCLKPLTPEMERIHMSTIFHFLKTKCPKMDIRCISGSRAEELYNQTRLDKASVSTPAKAPFTLDTADLTAKAVGLNNNTVRFDLSADDLHCLNEGVFLNDNIIDFYLQYIYYEKLSAEDRQRTYLFNTFFYKRLTQKDNRDNPDISAAERRYNRVKRWLRDVDLFSKNYIIVPINQNAHWYIVIIQNLNNVPTEKDLISDDEDEHFDDNSKAKKRRRSSRIIRAKSFSPEAAIELDDEPKDADEVASDDVALKVNIESLVGTKERSLAPAIIIFDSLRIASKIRVAATLREFLQLEYDHKKSLSNGSLTRKLFNIDTIPTIEAGVPQQRNYFDCGLYVLQYIESFFTHLSATIVVHASTFSNWCEKNLKGSMKRKEILNVINGHVITRDDS